MLCHQCRRAATVAVRQLSSATRAQSTFARPASKLRATIPITTGPYLRYHPSVRYSTASETIASSPQSSSTPEKPDYLDTAESEIWDKLTAEFSPTELMVQDVSGGCGSMYGIEIASEKFRGANMLKQQRMVNAVLGDQMKGWHGVQLRTKVPS
ncbi:BolA-like protein [Seiridium cupressi]